MRVVFRTHFRINRSPVLHSSAFSMTFRDKSTDCRRGTNIECVCFVSVYRQPQSNWVGVSTSLEVIDRKERPLKSDRCQDIIYGRCAIHLGGLCKEFYRCSKYKWKRKVTKDLNRYCYVQVVETTISCNFFNASTKLGETPILNWF